jgi:hypothetical protein
MDNRLLALAALGGAYWYLKGRRRNPTPYAEMNNLERAKDDLRLYRLQLKDVEAERKKFTGKKALTFEEKYRRDGLDYSIKDLKAKIGRSERTIKSWFQYEPDRF